MTNKYLQSGLDYLRVLVILVIVALEVVSAVLGDNTWFLLSSATIIMLALVNYLDFKDNSWGQYALLLFIAMILCFIGDLLMAGIFYITPITILNGVMLFSIGHIVYLLGLRERSPLLLQPKNETGSRLITRNLLIWILSIIIIIGIFYFTVFNPSEIVLSIGMLGYGILLVTVIGFSLTKYYDNFAKGYSITIFLGFCFFMFSDWLIGVHEMKDPSFLSGPWVGATYIIAQLLIHLGTVIGAKGDQ